MAIKSTPEKIQRKINSLPLIDVKVFEMMRLLNSPDSNFEQIVGKISPDLAARFLNIANSAYYGTEVRSIKHAVRLLGYREMKHILITSILLDHFTERLEYFSFEKFQKQAQFCAAVSLVLGQIVAYENLEDLFTVAILHNIGKLVIAVYFEEEHKEIIALKEGESLTSSEAEKRILGLTHAEIGALVLERFNIPQDICEAVRFHDTDNCKMPQASNFQLEVISRESARIVGNFELPKDLEPLEIQRKLERTIAEGKKIYRDGLKMKIRSKGYKDSLPDLLKQAGHLVYEALKEHLRERISQEDDGLDVLR
jgi:HD-like signal output (HDOD) protein